MSGLVATSRFVLRPVIDVLTKTSARGMTNYSRVVSGPPRVRISFAEKVAHGVFIFVGCSIIPFVISHYIPEYSKGSAEEED